MDATPGTVTIWSDIGCPWASLAVWRLHARRAALGLEDAVRFEHRCFPLELFNEKVTSRALIDAEVEVLAGLVPEAGWRPWTADPSEWPVTTLPALEAVQAAKEQGLEASERLDLSLRQALWQDSRCVSMRHVILECAEDESLDVPALAEALDSGRARSLVIADWQAAADGQAKASPHVFLPDGSDWPNPGIEQHWDGPKPGGRPVIDRDDVAVYDEILTRATT